MDDRTTSSSSSSSASASVSAPTVEWSARTHASSGRQYFVHSALRLTQWVPPPGFGDATERKDDASGTDDDVRCGVVAFYDARADSNAARGTATAARASGAPATTACLGEIRAWNNWVKASLITQTATMAKPHEAIRVLDLGCGRGGDVLKWVASGARVERFVGVDASAVSISHALHRAASSRAARNLRSTFIVADVMHSPPTVALCQPVDVVTLHFCANYAADIAVPLGVACRHLRPGGVVQLIFMNWTEIERRCAEAPAAGTMTTAVMSIRLESERRYHVVLEDPTSGACFVRGSEFALCFEDLEAAAAAHGLVCIHHLDDITLTPANKLSAVFRTPRALSEEARRVCSLYSAAVFQHVVVDSKAAAPHKK